MCHKEKTAPHEMWRGSATTDDQYAYFTPEDSVLVYRYDRSTETWEGLPSSPFSNSGLITMNSELTTVGGWDGRCHTNKMHSLQHGKWVEQPPMDIACSNSAVVSTSDGDYILVIGGEVEYFEWTAAVKLLHVSSKTCHELTKLPQALPQPSATVCGNELYVIGKDGDGYSCSLQFLASIDQPMRAQSISHTVTWTPLPQQPVTCSTATSLCGQLVIVGGLQCGSSVKSIYQLVDEEWVEVGSLSSGRSKCLVVATSKDKMMVVGGQGGEKVVEEFKAV